MMNIVAMTIVAALAQASPPTPDLPKPAPAIDCPTINLSSSDAMTIGGLAGRGNAAPTPAETAATERLKTATVGCEKKMNWSKAKTNHAYVHARAKALAAYAKGRITSRRLPVSAVERTYAKMTPAAKQALLAQRPDPSMQTLLMAELRAQKVNPANVTRDDAVLMGNLLAALATIDKTKADFSVTN